MPEKCIGLGSQCRCTNCAYVGDMAKMVSRALGRRTFETFEDLAKRILNQPRQARWKRLAAHVLLNLHHKPHLRITEAALILSGYRKR